MLENINIYLYILSFLNTETPEFTLKEDINIYIEPNQCHSCWWRSRDINSHGIDLICIEYSHQHVSAPDGLR